MTRFSRRFLAVGVLAALSLAAAITVEAQKKKRFEETTSVVVVEVPVTVISDGDPVRGLSAENFEVIDGRKKQPLIGFDVYDLSMVGADGRVIEAQEVPVTARRHFLLLFDLSFAEPSSVLRAREAARNLIRTALHPSDLVGVATYSQANNARIVLGFTPDRRQVEMAIDTLGIANPGMVADPLNLMIADVRFDAFADQELGSTADDGRGGRVDVDSLLVENARDLSILTQRANQDIRIQQVTALSSSLRELARLMANVQGRKHVVYLSEGFDSSIMLGTSGSTFEEQERIQEINAAAASGEFWRVNSDERFGSGAAQSVLGQMVEEFRRADCVVQSVDIGGARAGGDARGFSGSGQTSGQAAGEQGLFYMANETGGELIRNYNDLGQAMGEVLERSSVTYVLAFQPKDLELDGSYHQLKIKLKDVPRGTRVVHRPGYYAPKPFNAQNPFERRLLSAGFVLGGDPGGPIGLSVLAAPFQSRSERAYVPVLIEIDGKTLLAGSTNNVVPAEIFAYAIDSEGSIRDFFTQQMGLQIDKVGAALEQSGFKFWGDFELTPGEYVVRVMVRNGETGDFSVSSERLLVPAFDQAETALLAPFFPEQPGKWLLGREQSPDRETKHDYPFVMEGNAFIPAARPALASGAETTICLVGYNLPPGDLELDGQLLDENGQDVGGVALALAARPATGVSGLDRLVATVKPGKVPAGDYQLQVTIDGGGGSVESAVLPVTVGG